MSPTTKAVLSCTSILIPHSPRTLIVDLISSELGIFINLLFPLQIDAIINALCDIDLSPGSDIFPTSCILKNSFLFYGHSQLVWIQDETEIHIQGH